VPSSSILCVILLRFPMNWSPNYTGTSSLRCQQSPLYHTEDMNAWPRH
jgi:hypothetical protein